MPKRKYDLAVKTGSYTDAQGQQKNRYQNIGVVMQGDDGGHYMLIDPLINLGAIQRDPGKDRVMVSMFTPQERDGHPQGQAPRQPAPAQRPAPARAPVPADMDDDIPF